MTAQRADTTRVTTTGARCLALAVVLVLTGGQAAQATTAEDARAARASADEARDRVDAVTAELDAAVAARDEAMAALTSAAQQSISSERTAADAQAAAREASGQHARTIRALYRGGGELAVYSSVLSSSSVEEALNRAAMARRVLGFTAARSGLHEAGASAAETAARAADDAATTQVVTVADVLEATDRIERALAETQQVLDSLSQKATELEAAAEARRLLEEARQRAASVALSAGPASAVPIPVDYLTLYQDATRRCPGLRWTLLAAIGQVESRHGRNNGPSSAGAVGPMQFMPATFAAYGVDGDGDGVADPWNPWDAVHSAAVYLCINGGGGDEAQVQRALLRYNNAQWYVDLVLRVEAAIIATGQLG